MKKSVRRVTAQAVYQDGRYSARCEGISVFTQASTIQKLIKNLREAVCLHLAGEDDLRFDWPIRSVVILKVEGRSGLVTII